MGEDDSNRTPQRPDLVRDCERCGGQLGPGDRTERHRWRRDCELVITRRMEAMHRRLRRAARASYLLVVAAGRSEGLRGGDRLNTGWKTYAAAAYAAETARRELRQRLGTEPRKRGKS